MFLFIYIFIFFAPGQHRTYAAVTDDGNYPPAPPSEIQPEMDNFDTKPDSVAQPTRDLLNINKLIHANQPKELKDFLSKATCEDKCNCRDYIRYEDAVDIFKVKYSGMISLALVSMIGCPAAQIHVARMRVLFYPSWNYSSRTLRDLTEVLVTTSETAQMHDEFQKFQEPNDVRDVYESKRYVGLKGDVENACFELIERRREEKTINAQNAAKDLVDEKNDWDEKRGNLDYILMETPLEQLPAVFNEFKTLNQKSLEEELSAQLGEERGKLAFYNQLVKLGTSRTAYIAEELNAKLSLNEWQNEKSFPLANAIVWLAALSPDDRKKVEEEYQKNYSANLMEELDRILPTLECGEVVTEVLKMYLDEIKTK